MLQITAAATIFNSSSSSCRWIGGIIPFNLRGDIFSSCVPAVVRLFITLTPAHTAVVHGNGWARTPTGGPEGYSPCLLVGAFPGILCRRISHLILNLELVTLFYFAELNTAAVCAACIIIAVVVHTDCVSRYCPTASHRGLGAGPWFLPT